MYVKVYSQLTLTYSLWISGSTYEIKITSNSTINEQFYVKDICISFIILIYSKNYNDA